MLGFDTVDALTHGWSGLFASYTTATGALIGGLARSGVPPQRWLGAPVLGVPVAAASGMTLALAAPWLQLWGAAPASVLQLGVGVAITAGIGYASGRALAQSRSWDIRHQRGALVRETHDSKPVGNGSAHGHRHGREAEHASVARGTVTIAGIALGPADESKHTKLIGTTGTGKSTAIQEMLAGALRRGDRAVIADPDGSYLRRFYRAERGDVVLNPFAPGAAKWDLFGEMQQPYDAEQLARSLIPDHEGADRSWRSYARTFVASVTRQAHAAGVRDVAELYRLLVIAGPEELRKLVQGTAAQPFLDEHNSRMFDSVRSVASSAVGALEHIAEQRGSALSVRAWVRGGLGEHAAEPTPNAAGVLFIPYQATQIAALRSQISAWMRLAIFETMAADEEGDQRLWFIVDELDALGEIDGLKDALARLRKFGGRCVLGFQSIAQVSSTYGQGVAQTLVENCGNTLILRCSGSEGGGTSRFASGLIGEREVLRVQHSRTRRDTELFGSRTHSEHLTTEPALLASQIEQLPDLNGYLKLASHPEWLRVQLAVPTRSAATGLQADVHVRPERRAGLTADRTAVRRPARDDADLGATHG